MSLHDLWHLFRETILAVLLAGAVVPLVGAYLLLRRTSFHGLALPQFAAAGVSLGFLVLPWWVEHVGLGGMTVEQVAADTHAALNYHLGWAALATFGGLFVLVLVGRRLGTEVARVAGAFAVANAITILCAHLSPLGEVFVHGILTGETLAIGIHELETLLVVLGLVLACFTWFHHDLVLVSFDPESARVLGKRVALWELLLAGLTGLTVAAGTMSVGPMILFGLLVLPPLGARPFARSMPGYLTLAATLGVLASATGLLASFQLDLPPGPCVVVTAALLTLPGWTRATWFER